MLVSEMKQSMVACLPLEIRMFGKDKGQFSKCLRGGSTKKADFFFFGNYIII